MKNRTIYEVLDKAMEDYSYSIKKTGNKVEIKGSVFIPRVDIEVTHEKEFHYSPADKNLISDERDARLAKAIIIFKEELKDKVASIIKAHKLELTDDEAMIERLQYDIKSLQKELAAKEEELKESRDKIAKLELERLGTQPYTPYPWTNPNPWSTGITWETQIGDQPDWMNKNNITCSTGEGNTSATYGTGDEVRFNTSEHRKRNPKRFG